MSSNLKQQQSYLLNLNKILKKTILWEVWYKFSVLFQKGDILISIHPISLCSFPPYFLRYIKPCMKDVIVQFTWYAY